MEMRKQIFTEFTVYFILFCYYIGKASFWVSVLIIFSLAADNSLIMLLLEAFVLYFILTIWKSFSVSKLWSQTVLFLLSGTLLWFVPRTDRLHWSAPCVASHHCPGVSIFLEWPPPWNIRTGRTISTYTLLFEILKNMLKNAFQLLFEGSGILASHVLLALESGRIIRYWIDFSVDLKWLVLVLHF